MQCFSDNNEEFSYLLRLKVLLLFNHENKCAFVYKRRIIIIITIRKQRQHKENETTTRDSALHSELQHNQQALR